MGDKRQDPQEKEKRSRGRTDVRVIKIAQEEPPVEKFNKKHVASDASDSGSEVCTKHNSKAKAHKRKNEIKKQVQESDSDDEDTEDDVTSDEENEEESSSSEESDDVSFSSSDILKNDPLYYVLSKVFVSDSGKTIATILEEINQKLKSVVKH